MSVNTTASEAVLQSVELSTEACLVVRELEKQHACALVRIAMLESKYRHPFSSVGSEAVTDTCQACGLNIRDSIHERVKL